MLSKLIPAGMMEQLMQAGNLIQESVNKFDAKLNDIQERLYNIECALDELLEQPGAVTNRPITPKGENDGT